MSGSPATPVSLYGFPVVHSVDQPMLLMRTLIVSLSTYGFVSWLSPTPWLFSSSVSRSSLQQSYLLVASSNLPSFGSPQKTGKTGKGRVNSSFKVKGCWRVLQDAQEGCLGSRACNVSLPFYYLSSWVYFNWLNTECMMVKGQGINILGFHCCYNSSASTKAA